MTHRYPRYRVGTYEDFIKSQIPTRELFRVKDAEVYIGKDGSFYLITTKPWVDYIAGRSDKIPDDDDLHLSSELDDSELKEYLSN